MIEIGKNIIKLVLDDIVDLDCDAIVNAANKSLLGGGGVDGAIHEAAGNELYKECLTLNGCETGEAKITKGYNLIARHVIHTVGPVYNGEEIDKLMLSNCYKNSLEIAKENNLHSIAFPSISTGVYGYPKEEAASIAMATITKWCKENINYGITIIICTYSFSDKDCYDKYFE